MIYIAKCFNKSILAFAVCLNTNMTCNVVIPNHDRYTSQVCCATEILKILLTESISRFCGLIDAAILTYVAGNSFFYISSAQFVK